MVSKRIVVVGGGISGLAAAHRLVELGVEKQITLIEASGRLGGTLETQHRAARGVPSPDAIKRPVDRRFSKAA